MIISERVLETIDNDPKTAKFTTEYFMGFDKSDKNNIMDIVVKYQNNLPKLMEELNTIGYGVNATVLKSGRVVIIPRKKK